MDKLETIKRQLISELVDQYSDDKLEANPRAYHYGLCTQIDDFFKSRSADNLASKKIKAWFYTKLSNFKREQSDKYIFYSLLGCEIDLSTKEISMLDNAKVLGYFYFHPLNLEIRQKFLSEVESSLNQDPGTSLTLTLKIDQNHE